MFSNNLLVIAIIVIMMGAFFIWFLNYFYMQTLDESLYIQARLAVSLVEEMIDRNALPDEIDASTKALGQELGVRITLINLDGAVLADSDEDTAFMENHLDRPEIIEALVSERGTARRYSITLSEEMYYLAVPLGNDTLSGISDNPIAFVRLALPLASIKQAINNLLIFIVAALIIASLVALAAAAVFSHRITDPIRKISSASKAIAGGNYKPSIEVTGADELSELALNIKEMGQVLSKKMEQILWEKSKLETVLSSMTSGIILTDHDQKIELVNQAAEELFELRSNQVVGQPLHKAIRNHALNENLKAVYRNGELRLIEINLYYPRAAVLETYIMPVRGIEKGIIGIILLFNEVTQLRSIEKMRSDFVANVSHELRTPLTAVRGYTETIMHEELTREELLGFLEVIDRETNRLTFLVDDLLDLAQIENEKSFVRKETVDLSVMINEAIQRVSDLREKRNIDIVHEIFSERFLVEGNYGWLCQAMVNILENSIRHGSPEGKIAVKMSSNGTEAVIEISDNGPGIPEADLPYVFERFYRVDKARSRKSGGTGLGLSIVKHIMEAHGADYSLESIEGKGTIFRFSLPLII